MVVGSDRWPDIDGERFGAVFLYEDRGTVLCKVLNAIYCDGFESKESGNTIRTAAQQSLTHQ